MEIWSIENERDRQKALKLCETLLEKNALIPIVGSGFSRDTQTDNKGIIPSVNTLKQMLFEYVKLHSGYSMDELKEIENKDLFDIADVFLGIFHRIPENEKRLYFDYIKSNFLDVSFFKGFQEAFLRVHWPYLFTLNYDSLIEDFDKSYYPVIPYDRINRRSYAEKIKVFKLHGDARKYYATADDKYLILSRIQYVNSLTNSSNEDMLNELQTAFSSKSILFFGCGLNEELDLLYESQISILEKAKEIDPDHQAIIYISYEYGKDDSSELSLMTKDRLARYGVTHILRVFTEQQSELFFKDLSQFSIHLPQPGIDSFLEQHSAMRCHFLKSNDTQSRDYIFHENMVWKDYDKHIISIPGYYVNRTQTNEVLKSISSGEPLYFISGNFYSGKTFFLIALSNYFNTKKVFIFPSGTNITDFQLQCLLTKEDSLYCFDSKTISTNQIKHLSQEKELYQLRVHRSCAIIVIDAFDAPMYKYIFEARNNAQEFPITRVNGIFDNEEWAKFNHNIGEISLPPYSKNETLLDYVVRNEKELVMSSNGVNHFLEPNKKLLSVNTQERIKALIMLATEIRISAQRAIQFGIDVHINDIIQSCKDASGTSVIEKDYYTYCGDSSGYEFVCNSKYWIMRALSTYAGTRTDKLSLIAEAYYSIVQTYYRFYKDDFVKFYQKCEPYYYFDHIQLLFNNRWFTNPGKLVTSIYDRLLGLLSNSFQFLHQKAKGKLYIAQDQFIRNDKLCTLKEAHLNITRAIELAKQFPDAKNIKETLLHMLYTKGRIMIELCSLTLSYVPKAVDACYELYEMQQGILHDVYDFTTGTGKDKASFEKFKSNLLSNDTVHNFIDLDTTKAEALLKRWTGKTVRFSKNTKNNRSKST